MANELASAPDMTPPTSPHDISIELLSEHHDLSDFTCGETDLDEYLKNKALLSSVEGYGRTYVTIKPGHKRVWAYFTLAPKEVKAKSFPAAPSPPSLISVLLLGRFAIHQDLQGQHYGRELMAHVFEISVKAADLIGGHAIILDAQNEGVKAFYTKFGFTPFWINPCGCSCR